MRLGRYLGRGDISEDNINLEDLLWDDPRRLEEHCNLVPAEVGTHIATTF